MQKIRMSVSDKSLLFSYIEEPSSPLNLEETNVITTHELSFSEE